MQVTERVILRLGDQADPAIIQDYVRIITDRLCLRLHEEYLPKRFEGIAADATVKLYRRAMFEGIKSEWTADLKTEFIEDILSEYAAEINSYLEEKAKKDGDRTLYFL